MRTTIHAARTGIGAAAVLAAGLVMSACGNEQAVDPDPATVVGQITAPSPTPTCSYTADQMQRRIDAGQPGSCHGRHLRRNRAPGLRARERQPPPNRVLTRF